MHAVSELLSISCSTTFGGVQEVADWEQQIMNSMLQPERCLQFMRPGRLLHIQGNDKDWNWGVLVSYVRTANLPAVGVTNASGNILPPREDADKPDDTYVLNCLLLCGQSSSKSESCITTQLSLLNLTKSLVSLKTSYSLVSRLLPS